MTYSVSTNYPILDASVDHWEAALSHHQKFLRVTPENRSLFFAMLGKEVDLDSYSISPVYYALTGRKGLWIYQDGNTYIPLCWHPNTEGQILVFPLRGENNPLVMTRLLNEIPTPPAGIRLARIKKSRLNSKNFSKPTHASERLISYAPVQELILDWRYPVRVLSTEIVSSMRGHSFMRTRNHVNQAKRNSISVCPLNSSHTAQLINFIYKWANKRTNNFDELIDLLDPYKKIFELHASDDFNLDGLVFIIDGAIQGLTIWEMPNSKNAVANSWVNICNTGYTGISEFMMKALAETLLKKGINLFNLGGSETKGLDDYKMKYSPAHNISLSSVEVIIEGRDLLLESLIKCREMRLAV